MKLVVCGCSWSSRDPNYPDTEFGYFVSKELGWEYQNYGRVGCDNFSIRLQVDQAIKDQADFVIINWTTACRFSWNHSGKAYDPRLIVGWPTAEIAVMGGAQAAKVLLQIEMASLKAKGETIDKKKEDGEGKKQK